MRLGSSTVHHDTQFLAEGASPTVRQQREHQPVADGVQQTPRNVTFGEGSLDEMCLHYDCLSGHRMRRLATLEIRRVFLRSRSATFGTVELRNPAMRG